MEEKFSVLHGIERALKSSAKYACCDTLDFSSESQNANITLINTLFKNIMLVEKKQNVCL